MTVSIVIQARIGSSRSPGKITHKFHGEPMLSYQIRRLKNAGFNSIYVATTDKAEDFITEEIAKTAGVECFRGSECDVLGRYLACAEFYDLDQIIRVGGDDPLIDPEGLRALVELFKLNQKVDLIYASHPCGWIYGTAGELVTRKGLRLAANSTSDPNEREHVVTFLKRCPEIHSIKAIPYKKELIRPDVYVSVDYAEDLELVDQIIGHFTQLGKRYEFTQEELILLYDSGRLSIKNKHLHSGF